jgi:hypothetical protein
MNGTSGFQEVRSSISRSPSYRLLREQQPQFGTGAWHLLRAHDLIGLPTDISTKRETVPDTVFMPIFMRTVDNNSLVFWSYSGGRDETT